MSDFGACKIFARRSARRQKGPFRQSLTALFFATPVCIGFKNDLMCRHYNKVKKI